MPRRPEAFPARRPAAQGAVSAAPAAPEAPARVTLPAIPMTPTSASSVPAAGRPTPSTAETPSAGAVTPDLETAFLGDPTLRSLGLFGGTGGLTEAGIGVPGAGPEQRRRPDESELLLMLARAMGRV